MTPELARELEAALDSRPLPTTMSGAVYGPDGTQIDPERAVLLRVVALDTATRALITDARKRRGDVQHLVDEEARTLVRLAVLETSEPEPPSAGTPWLWAAAALLLGGTIALHSLEIAVLAALWWTRCA